MHSDFQHVFTRKSKAGTQDNFSLVIHLTRRVSLTYVNGEIRELALTWGGDKEIGDRCNRERRIIVTGYDAYKK